MKDGGFPVRKLLVYQRVKLSIRNLRHGDFADCSLFSFGGGVVNHRSWDFEIIMGMYHDMIDQF